MSAAVAMTTADVAVLVVQRAVAPQVVRPWTASSWLAPEGAAHVRVLHAEVDALGWIAAHVHAVALRQPDRAVLSELRLGRPWHGDEVVLSSWDSRPIAAGLGRDLVKVRAFVPEGLDLVDGDIDQERQRYELVEAVHGAIGTHLARSGSTSLGAALEAGAVVHVAAGPVDEDRWRVVASLQPSPSVAAELPRLDSGVTLYSPVPELAATLRQAKGHLAVPGLGLLTEVEITADRDGTAVVSFT
jgi:subtilisin family serine protease